MTTSAIDSVIAALGAFELSANDAENVSKLYGIFDGFRSLEGRQLAMPAMFNLLERFPETELGSPGPLVHELEAIAGYQSSLRESLHRQPANLTVWMVNRILNSELSDTEHAAWLAELKGVLSHERAAQSTRESARDFLEYLGCQASE